MIARSNNGYGYLDHERQEFLLAQSQLNWTAIRPTGLVNLNADKTVNISFENNPKPSLIISRKSVAQFTVKVLEEATFVGSAPVISW